MKKKCHCFAQHDKFSEKSSGGGSPPGDFVLPGRSSKHFGSKKEHFGLFLACQQLQSQNQSPLVATGCKFSQQKISMRHAQSTATFCMAWLAQTILGKIQMPISHWPRSTFGHLQWWWERWECQTSFLQPHANTGFGRTIQRMAGGFF